MSSGQRSDSRSRAPVPTTRTNSPMRSQGSTPSGSPAPSRPGSSSGAQPAGSPESDRVDTLESLRVVIQDQKDPMQVAYAPPTSRYFRLAAFAMHLGLSMLEAQNAKALTATGTKIWYDVGRRGRKGWAFQDDLTKTPGAMAAYTTSFLRKCRASSPTIVITDRLFGDGVTQRLAWGTNANIYNAKQAALFQINKSLFDNVLTAAAKNDMANLEKALFFLALTVAHEMVHVYFGFLTADEGRNTPALTNYPEGLSVGAMNGESGRYWEGQFIGAVTKAYYQPGDPLGLAQAGILYFCEKDDRGYELSQAWIKECITGKFGKPTVENNGLKTNKGKPFGITKAMKTMEDVRPRSQNCGVEADNPYTLIGQINRLAPNRVDRVNLQSIMSMVTNPKKLMAVDR